ncbi:hypothetical protein ACFTRD_26935 [Paenibacillus sp. NPDC056933]|uniref:hypothetical protein n=1 Tax=Paenibacillus sp. NPDC056933 TaxID=3345968 RepID=UPI00363FF06C
MLYFSLDKYLLPVLVVLVHGYYGMDYRLLYLGVAISILLIICIPRFLQTNYRQKDSQDIHWIGVAHGAALFVMSAVYFTERKQMISFTENKWTR